MMITQENVTTGIYLFFALTGMIILFGALIIHLGRPTKKKGIKNGNK